MLIAQISDTHISPKGRKAYGIAPMAENLLECIEHINQLVPTVDLVLVSGDLTNTGTMEETEHARELLDNLQAPYFVIPGNHDDRETIWSVFARNSCPDRHQGFINYAIDGYELRIIALDSIIPGAPGGEICETRANWLDQRLADAPSKPTLIFTHHPPIKFGVLETDEDGFSGNGLLADIVRKYSNIVRIACGHIHLPSTAGWCGTVISTAPSMGMQLSLDLTLKQPSRFYLEAPAFQLHYWSDEQNLVTHTVHLRKNEGPFLFEEQ